jgi:hypothetical protein
MAHDHPANRMAAKELTSFDVALARGSTLAT